VVFIPTRHAIKQVLSDQKPAGQQRGLRFVVARPRPREAGRTRTRTHPGADEPALPRPVGTGRHADRRRRLRRLGSTPALSVPTTDQATGRCVIHESAHRSCSDTRRRSPAREAHGHRQAIRLGHELTGIEAGREKYHGPPSQGGAAQTGRASHVCDRTGTDSQIG
jgi:hypothetical protein